MGVESWDDVNIPRLVEEVEAHLRSAERLELLSLDPFNLDPKTGGFHRFQVLGSTVLDSQEQAGPVVDQVLGGVHPWPQWRCVFVPRHGLRASQDGWAVELVICFECGELHVHRSWAEAKRVGLSRQGKELLNAILTGASVTLAQG